jgi:hypothetical protein
MTPRAKPKGTLGVVINNVDAEIDFRVRLFDTLALLDRQQTHIRVLSAIKSACSCRCHAPSIRKGPGPPRLETSLRGRQNSGETSGWPFELRHQESHCTSQSGGRGWICERLPGSKIGSGDRRRQARKLRSPSSRTCRSHPSGPEAPRCYGQSARPRERAKPARCRALAAR